MADNTDLKLTVDAWADITIKLFHQRMDLLQIRDTGALRQSLVRTVMVNSNGDPERVVFAFNLYGRFVDMGVGRETSRGNGGDIGRSKLRKQKKWYNTVLMKEKYILAKILAHKFGIKTTLALKDVIGSRPDGGRESISIVKLK